MAEQKKPEAFSIRGIKERAELRAKLEASGQILPNTRGREPSQLHTMSESELKQYVDREADEISKMMDETKIHKKMEDGHTKVIEDRSTQQTTVCVTVLQKKGEGPESRRVLLTSSAESYESKVHITGVGPIVEIGPYLKPWKDENGQVEKRKEKGKDYTIKSIEGPDGKRERYDPCDLLVDAPAVAAVNTPHV